MFDNLDLYKIVLSGFWPRFFAAVCLGMAFWFGIYRRRFLSGGLFFMLSVIFTYFTGFIGDIFGWLIR